MNSILRTFGSCDCSPTLIFVPTLNRHHLPFGSFWYLLVESGVWHLSYHSKAHPAIKECYCRILQGWCSDGDWRYGDSCLDGWSLQYLHVSSAHRTPYNHQSLFFSTYSTDFFFVHPCSDVILIFSSFLPFQTENPILCQSPSCRPSGSRCSAQLNDPSTPVDGRGNARWPTDSVAWKLARRAPGIATRNKKLCVL